MGNTLGEHTLMHLIRKHECLQASDALCCLNVGKLDYCTFSVHNTEPYNVNEG